MPSSSESLNCRIDWRPSRMLAAALAMLGLLAAVALWLSDAPSWLVVLGGFGAITYGLALARWELRKPRVVASWREIRAVFRGGLVTASGTDESGGRQTLHWWPDTLDGDSRRRLRLAMTAGSSA